MDGCQLKQLGSHLGIFPGLLPIFSSLLTVPLQQDQWEGQSPDSHPLCPSAATGTLSLSWNVGTIIRPSWGRLREHCM